MSIHTHSKAQMGVGGWTVAELVAHLKRKHGIDPVTRNLVRMVSLHITFHPGEGSGT